MSNSEEKRIARTAQAKGFRLEKVGKGSHHGRFAIVNIAQGSRVTSSAIGAEFTFSLQEADDWLTRN